MKLLIVFLVMLMVGCRVSEPSAQTGQLDLRIGEVTVKKAVIEGHDYYYLDGYNSYALTHSGNCKACEKKTVVITDTLYVREK